MERFDVSVEILRKNPDIILFRNLLSKEECEHIIAKAEKYMSRSRTFTSGNDPRRTSSSAFTNNKDFFNDKIWNSIRERCAALSGFPVSHVEIPQIVRYFPGEKFMTHTDAYEKTAGSYKISGQRDYTFFIYLNEPPTEIKNAGGETSFPCIPKPGTDWEKRDFINPITVAPEQGMGAFWRSIDTVTGDTIKNTWHEGLPTKGWVKWGMNVWIRHLPFRG